MKYTIAEAERHFESLIDFAIAGEQVTICLDSHNAVQLVRINAPQPVQSGNVGPNE